MSQFPKVNCSRGAPMGRGHVGNLGCGRRTVRLFRVRLDSGGYDDGGAYWGIGPPSVYCARNPDGEEMFTRARSRDEAADLMHLDDDTLIIPRGRK